MASMARLASVRSFLHDRGYDIFKTFDVRWYNRVVKPSLHLGNYNRDPSVGGSLGILVGNSRALWPIFSQHIISNPGWNRRKDPLDDYTRHVISSMASEFLSDVTHDVRYSFELQPDRVVAIQKVATGGSV